MIFSRIFLSLEGDPKRKSSDETEEEKVITNTFADARVYAHMLRKIARSTVSKSAQMRAAVVYGSKVRACCSRVVVFCVFARGLASGGRRVVRCRI